MKILLSPRPLRLCLLLVYRDALVFLIKRFQKTVDLQSNRSKSALGFLEQQTSSAAFEGRYVMCSESFYVSGVSILVSACILFIKSVAACLMLSLGLDFRALCDTSIIHVVGFLLASLC